MNRLLRGMVFAGALAISADASAYVGIPNENNDGIPDLNEAFNIVAGTSFASNADLQPFRVDPHDALFRLNSNSSPLIGLTAGHTNELGYYTDPGIGSSRFLTGSSFSGFGFTGDGSVGNPFAGVLFLPDPGNAIIGFFIESTSGKGTNTFFSEKALNSDGMDHLVTYRLPDPISVFADFGDGAQQVQFSNPLLLGFEDLKNGGDKDFDDMIYLVDAVAVPEPATLGLLGLGLAGFAFAVRRRARQAS